MLPSSEETEYGDFDLVVDYIHNIPLFVLLDLCWEINPSGVLGLDGVRDCALDWCH